MSSCKIFVSSKSPFFYSVLKLISLRLETGWMSFVINFDDNAKQAIVRTKKASTFSQCVASVKLTLHLKKLSTAFFEIQDFVKMQFKD